MNDVPDAGLEALSRGGMRNFGRWAFCAAVLGMSLTPTLLTLKKQPPDVEKVQEMRTLAAWPNHWEGGLTAVDKNFAAFERWFNDNLAYRSLFIRLKNQIDYSVFRTSSRVYFGKDEEIYGRQLLDEQLPAAEKIFSDPANASRIAGQIKRMSNELKAHGITMILLTPMQRQHFSRKGQPFFAPRVQRPSHFMTNLYPRLQSAMGGNFVDVYGLMERMPADQPRFFKQDFHWSDFSARAASMAVASTIAGTTYQWKYPLETYTHTEVGTDARFAALLSEKPVAELRVDNRKWPAVHQVLYLDTVQGYEYETDVIADPALLPSTCVYGNSFTDGMVNVGFLNHFQKFTRLWRDLPIEQVPAKAAGRCDYLVVQLLDISPSWAALNK